MNRTSKAVNLVLISSSMILAGCGRPPPTTAQDTRTVNRTGTYAGGGYYHYGGGRSVFIPWGGGGGTRGPSGATISPRGGFGAAGLAHAGS